MIETLKKMTISIAAEEDFEDFNEYYNFVCGAVQTVMPQFFDIYDLDDIEEIALKVWYSNKSNDTANKDRDE